jgi:hypothetical protein
MNLARDGLKLKVDYSLSVPRLYCAVVQNHILDYQSLDILTYGSASKGKTKSGHSPETSESVNTMA